MTSPAGDNPFAILQLPMQFDLDDITIRKAYIQHAGQSHPDRSTDPEQQMELAARTAVINRAYQQLKDPQSRAEALLVAQGGPAQSEDKSLPTDWLMEMMDCNEQLEAAQRNGETQQIHTIEQQLHQKLNQTFEQIQQLFQAWQPPDDLALAKAIRVKLNAVGYIQRLIERLNQNRNNL